MASVAFRFVSSFVEVRTFDVEGIVLSIEPFMLI